jgi:hypothetical protein
MKMIPDTPDTVWERALLCEQAIRSINETLVAMSNLEDQDGPLASLKMALRKERDRLEDRANSLQKRRNGMLAQ